MRILYAALKYDYGQPQRGYSFEHYNFLESLAGMGHEILYADTGLLQSPVDRQRWNPRLQEVVRREKPDVLFTVAFRDEFDRDLIRQITRELDGRTVCWFCDDHWRFDSYTREVAPGFGWSVTTSAEAVEKYQAIGYANVIASQWACNHFRYRRTGQPMRYDVTFVGQNHGDRPAWIETLRKAGIDIQTWGSGWPAGRAGQEQMIEIFNTSRINLNLSNASTNQPFRPPTLVQKVMRRLRPAPPAQPMTIQPLVEQIKGRNFEVPGCGGFMLTGRAQHLEEYYTDGREIACFSTPQEMLERVRHYLDHESDRAAIADAGYRRTLAEHTYVHRLTGIFRRMGLAVPDAAAAMANPRAGSIHEVLA